MMFHVSMGSCKPLQTTVVVSGTLVKMEIDTGASVSIISEERFNSIREGKSLLELKPSTVRLQTYTGESIPILGSTQAVVEYSEQTASLPLIVTQGNGPTLIGRDWLMTLRLDWQTIFRTETQTSHTLREVLAQNSEVFKPGLGTLQGATMKIHVDLDAQPRYHRPRSVPFALRSKVDEELQRLQSLGMIEPVQFSEFRC